MLQDSPMFAYIPAKDLNRARQFYEGKLGFIPLREEEGGVVYEFGDHTACFLYPTPNAGTSRASQAFWQVDDVEREVAELKARGVTFEEYDMPGIKTVNGIASTGDNRAAWFKDTEGNILAIIGGGRSVEAFEEEKARKARTSMSSEGRPGGAA